MAETSGFGGAGGTGFTPAGTPHYSGYGSYGFYRSRAMPRRYAALLLLAAPFIGVAGTYAAASLVVLPGMAGKYAARRYGYKAVPRVAVSTGGGSYLGKKVADFAKKKIKKKIRKEAIGFAWEYAKDKFNYYQERFEKHARQDVASSRRRRRIAYEYAYKF